MQMGELAAEKEKLQEKLRSLTDSNQRTIRSLEGRIQTLQDDLEVTRSEMKAVQSEYDGYKVRVHSVLKQQKKGSQESAISESEKMERERLEKAVEQLKNKIQDLSDKLKTAETDMEIQQEENSHLLGRYNKLLTDLQEKDSVHKRRLEDVNHEKTLLMKEQKETIHQLNLQNETLALSFKDQIQSLQEDQSRAINMLQMQIDSLERENTRLQRELQQQMSKVISVRSTAVTERQSPISSAMELVVHDIRHEERQEGEGSEIVDPEPCSKGIMRPSPLPLDKLLSTGPEDTVHSKELTELEVETLKENLSTAHKRIEHLTELSSENEATVMRLEEQAKILKEEIRRLERNQQREKEAANMEYLKNILLKFLSLKVGDERQQLVPVLTTMLKLSPEEKTTLDAAAQGEDNSANQPQQQQQQGGGWGSYLHRWSGLV